jgi:hypothetical protein
MAFTRSELVLEVTVTDPTAFDTDLSQAETLVRQEAMKHGGGVLITRHSQNRFTVTISDSVPFGLTREQSIW